MKRIYPFLIFLLLSNLAYSQVTQGLILDYDLNGDAFDNTGNGNHGIVNAVTLILGPSGPADSALHFTDTASVTIPNDSLLKPALPVTLSIDFKVDSLGQTRPLYHSDIVANNYVGFFVNLTPSGQPMAHIGDNTGGTGPNNRRSFLASNAITVGQWHNVVVIISDYNDMRIFIDCVESPGNYSGGGGQSIAYSSASGGLAEGPATFNHPLGFFFDGDMGHVKLWDRALTTSEVEDVCISCDKQTGVPNINLGVDQFICSGDTLNGVGVNLVGFLYDWTFLGGSTVGISDSTVASPQFYGINNSATPQTNTVELKVSTAAGCTKRDTIKIVVNQQPVADFSVDTAACLGDTLSFMDNSSNSVTDWFWDFGQMIGDSSIQQNPTFVYNSTGTYFVNLTVSDGVCDANETQEINIYPAIEFAEPDWPDSICIGDSLNLSIAGVGYTDVSWDIGTGVIQTTQNAIASYQATGTYTISLILNNQGCDVLIEQDIVAYSCGWATSIPELASHLIKVYPNPTSGNIFIELKNGISGEIILTDIRGRTIVKQNVSEPKTIINSNMWAGGIYFLTIRTDKGLYREKIRVR